MINILLIVVGVSCSSAVTIHCRDGGRTTTTCRTEHFCKRRSNRSELTAPSPVIKDPRIFKFTDSDGHRRIGLVINWTQERNHLMKHVRSYALDIFTYNFEVDYAVCMILNKTIVGKKISEEGSGMPDLVDFQFKYKNQGLEIEPGESYFFHLYAEPKYWAENDDVGAITNITIPKCSNRTMRKSFYCSQFYNANKKMKFIETS